MKKKSPLAVCMTAVMCAVLVACICIAFLMTDSKIENELPVGNDVTQSTQEQTQAEVYKVDEITVGSAGDVLIHIPVLNSAKDGNGGYNFDGIFTYYSEIIGDCDYFVANLETTLAGTENGRKYTGFPCFNSPDAVVASLKRAGVDCLLTANNHTYDTGAAGVKRTLEVVRASGLDTLGTRVDESEKKYHVEDVGGLKIGFACFTYETDTTSAPKALNGINVGQSTANLINSFNYNKLGEFYSELEAQLTQMKNEGAQFSVVYLHWGNEYQTYTDSHQKSIAQKLCDLGVDVIIGGHPHVVQPVELITSSNGEHKTVCVYSMGNMVSNQRRAYMGLKTGHTEDGLTFLMNFSLFSDGSFTFDSVEAVETWVHMYNRGGKTVYNVVPLDESFNAGELGLTFSSNGTALAKESYKRTDAIVYKGIKETNDWLSGKTETVAEPEASSAETVQ